MSKAYVLGVDEDGNWMSAKDSQLAKKTYHFQSEYAKSSRSRCRVCSENIKKGEIRLGKSIKWGGGANGFINSWSHVICTRVAEGYMDDFNASKHIHGFDNFKTSEQKEIIDELKQVGQPTHLKSIDPNDPEFLKNLTLPSAKQPKDLLNISLLPYQEEGFGWMCKQEHSNVRGGVLADEMGLGKTIQAIALIVATKEERLVATRLVHAAKEKALAAAASAKEESSSSSSSSTTTSSTSSSSSSSTSTEIVLSTPKKKKKGGAKTASKKKGTTKSVKNTKKSTKKNTKKSSKSKASQPVEDVLTESDADEFTPNSRRKSLAAEKVAVAAVAAAVAAAKTAAAAAASPPKSLLPATHPDSLPASDLGCPENGPTLIVAPSACLLQWHEELKRCAPKLSVLVVHGAKRKKYNKLLLASHDVVLTTYPVLQYDYRECVNKLKVSCAFCPKLFLPRSLVTHNAYFCGPTSKRTIKLAKTEKKSDTGSTGSKKQRTQSKEATAKGMVTLGITNHKDAKTFVERTVTETTSSGITSTSSSSSSSKRGGRGRPTLTGIYRDMMKEAGREPLSMYAKGTGKMKTSSIHEENDADDEKDEDDTTGKKVSNSTSPSNTNSNTNSNKSSNKSSKKSSKKSSTQSATKSSVSITKNSNKKQVNKRKRKAPVEIDSSDTETEEEEEDSSEEDEKDNKSSRSRKAKKISPSRTSNRKRTVVKSYAESNDEDDDHKTSNTSANDDESDYEGSSKQLKNEKNVKNSNTSSKSNKNIKSTQKKNKDASTKMKSSPSDTSNTNVPRALAGLQDVLTPGSRDSAPSTFGTQSNLLGRGGRRKRKTTNATEDR